MPVTSDDDIGRLFEPLEHLLAQQRALGEHGPAPGSKAHRDAKHALGEIAWTLAIPAFAIGLDHLLSWREIRTVAKKQPTFAHLTLLRGAIEGTAVSRWLADPTITASERVRRSAGVQLADYQQRLVLERRVPYQPVQPASGRTAAQRIAALERLLRMRAVRPEPMPSATDLFRRYAYVDDPETGEALFRFMSGMAHGKTWSLFAMSELGSPTTGASGTRVLRVQAREDLTLLATRLAMRAAVAGLDDLQRYGCSVADD